MKGGPFSGVGGGKTSPDGPSASIDSFKEMARMPKSTGGGKSHPNGKGDGPGDCVPLGNWNPKSK